MKRRILSIITALALCLSLCPTWALAAEADPSLCKHHPKHTEDCGYTAPTEGHDCGHEHTEDCYTTDEAGGEVLDCQHSHNSECGYVQADPGAPCGYVCHICPIEDLIAALPEQVTEDNRADVRGQLDYILDLYRELNEDEQEEINLSRCYALQGALDNANAPIQAAEEIDISQNWNNILTEEAGGCPGHTFTGTNQTAIIYVESGTHNVTFSGLNITASAQVGIAPDATMNLTINGTNTIHAGINLAGIYVPADAALVIQGAGSLDVSGSEAGAGIGGAVYVPDENGSDGDPNCGTVEIKGGIVTATGGSCCAGIGGGRTNDAPGNGGTVTINGGTVTATGGSDGYYGGAGIGGCAGASASDPAGNGGTLTINGGTVNLTAGTHYPQYPAYGFGQGSGSAPTGTCELTLADASYLTVDSLDPNGKYTINGDPTADMIVVPEDLIYNGKAQELDGKIYIDDSKTGTGTYFNQTFTVKASKDGWNYTISPAEVKEAGNYTVTFSKEGHTSISKTFTVAKSGTQFVGDGEVKTYKDGAECSDFTAGDTITVKAAPTPTGAAPQKAAARLQGGPGTGQMALYVGDALVSSEAADADADGIYTMTVSASDVLTLGGVEPNGDPITLTAKFVGNDNMADGAGTVKVNITAVAKAEKGGTVIGYYGESGLDAALADKNNEGAVFTLLDNMEREIDLKINISCTLDLNGKTIRSTGQYASALYTYYDTTVTIRGEGTVISEQGHGFSVGGTTTLEGGTFISGAANCGGVYVQAGKLIVTGEAVVIENTGGGTGLGVGYNAEAQLSGGTYSSIWVDSPHTLAGLLNQEGASRVAYYKDNTTLVTEGLDGQALPGTVTVKACTHAYQYAHTTGTTTHSQTCPACGDAKASEKCDFSNGPCPCGAVLAVTLPADLNLTYNGTAQEPGVTVTVDGTPLDASNYEVTYADNINAGTNAAKVTVTGKNYTGTTTLNFTIGKATPTIAWNPIDVETIYTGQPANVKPVVTLVNGETYTGEIHYSWYDAHGWNDSLVPPTDVRTYGNIKASIPEQDNYNAAITEIGLNLHIDYADQAAPAAPTAEDANIKDNSITLTAIENAEYKMGDGEWQDSPEFAELSPNTQYTFYARLKADDNHNASPSSAGTSITTRKAMLENASVTITGTYTYTGAAIVPEAGNVEVVLNGTKIDSDQYTISASNNINAGVGKATLTVTATETGNYSGSVSSTFTIGKATLTIKANDQTITYGGSIATGTDQVTPAGLVGGDTLESVTLTPDTKDVPGGRIIASEVQIQNESGADVTGNYEITYVPGALIINKSQPTIAFADGYNPGKTYDGQTIPNPVEANLTITGATFGDVAFAWSATPKNAGTYTLTASIPVTDNTEAASATLSVTISPKAVTPTITITPSSYEYTGSAIHPSGSAVKVMDGDTVIPDSEYTLSYGENTQVGNGSVTVTDKENGNYTVNGTTTFTITAKPLTGAKVEVTGTFTYTGNALTPVPTVTLDGKTLAENTDYTVDYTDNTNAGTAKITVTGTGNYSGTAQGTFTIGRATLTADGTGTASGTYGDKLSELTVSGLTAKLGETTVTGTWKLAGGMVPNVGDSGEYTATFTPATGADNYNALEAKVTLNIAKANYTGTTTASTSAKFGSTGTYDLSALLPDGATAGTAATDSDIFEGTPTVSGKTLTYQLKAGATVGSTGPITVPVTSANYIDFNLTITVKVTDKDVPTLTVSPITVTYIGQAIPANAIQGTAKVGDAIVPGTWAFASGEAVTNVADSGAKTVKFVPTDKETYAEATGTVVVTINKATPTGAPKYTAISANGKTLADAGLTAVGGTFNTEGTVAWTLDNTTEVTANTQYEWTFTPADTANYNTLTGKITLWPYTTPVNPGGGYVPSGPGGSSLPVTTTGQGSSTVTTTTTAAPTASVSNGTATTTINTAMGNEIVRQATANKSENVVIAPSVTGNVTKAEVSIPASTVGQIGSQTNASLTVSTPVADVTIPNGGLGSLSSAGGTVTVTAEQVGSSVELTVTAGGRTVQNVPGGVTLTVPAANTTPGTVAVLVHGDGTREVVRKSVADNGAVTIPLDGSAKLEIVDNSKYFADVPATSWATDAVAFASAHELFGGTGANQFSPDLPMSRGMLAVVLHNLENNPAQTLTGAFTDVDNSQWYAEGVAWAEAQGIIGGYGNGQFGPNDNITREQLAVMLWRYAGSPAATDRELHFADAHRASDWALEALRWATEKGIINGKGSGILDPTGQATRAETAQMLKNFMESK